MAENRTNIEKLTGTELILRDDQQLEKGGRRYPDYGDKNKNKASDTIDLWESWRKLRKHKWLIAGIAVIITAIVTIEAFRTRPWYEASMMVEIDKDSPALFRSGDVTINDDSDPYYMVNVKTKMLLLSSRELHEDVIVNLKLEQNPKFFDVTQSGSLWGRLRGGSPRPSDKDQTVLMETGDDKTIIQLLGGLPRTPSESAHLAPYVDVLERNLTIEQIRDTKAIKVSFTHTDPYIAAAVVDNMVQNFMQRNFQGKTDKFTSTADWLDRTTRELKAKVEQSEQALVNYTRENKIFATSFSTEQGKEKATLTTEKLTRLHDQFIRTQTDRILKKSLYDELQAGNLAQLPEAYSDPKITAYQREVTDLSTNMAELRVKYGPMNPRVMEVKQQIDVLQKKIDDGLTLLEAKLRSEYERAVQDEQSLQDALNQAKGDAVNENQAAIRYNILLQDVETSRSLYTGFLQKTNQAKAQVAEQYNNIRVLQHAQVPMKPEGPRRFPIILIGLIVSLGGGVGLALVLEYLDNTVKSVSDITEYAKLPTLGVIPAIDYEYKGLISSPNGADGNALEEGNIPQAGKLQRASKHNNKWSVTEAYRALRTSVLLSSAGGPPKTILVTSGQPSEGKTTTVLNTAVSLAQLGSSVLVIDCDMRRPSTHRLLGRTQGKGLSTYLTSDADIDKLIQDLPIPNMSWLPCGPVPPNPAELISGPKMKELLTTLSKRYDHILIDSSPLTNVTDPVILSTIVDGVILVVRASVTKRELVLRSCSELSSVGARLLGVVLNNVNIEREGYDYYYSNYGETEGQLANSESFGG